MRRMRAIGREREMEDETDEQDDFLLVLWSTLHSKDETGM